MEDRYPDAPPSEKGTTIETGDWFEDFARDQMEKAWGISPKSYKSAEYQLSRGEGRYCEFKHDPHTQYKHLAIEVSERAQRGGIWAPGGIFRESVPLFYVQGDRIKIWHFATHMLIRYARSIGIFWDHDNWILHDDEEYVHEYNETMKRFFLEYENAKRIGGVCIICEVESND